MITSGSSKKGSSVSGDSIGNSGSSGGGSNSCAVAGVAKVSSNIRKIRYMVVHR
jgi:hypothetical protein